MIAHLVEEIAMAAIAAVGLATEKWRESAAYRAAKLQARIELEDEERRRQHLRLRPQRVRRWRWRRLEAAAIAQEKVTQDQCDCLEKEVSRRVAAAVQAAIDAAKHQGSPS